MENSKQISYPSLRCIMEHIELNKRCAFVARAPTLANLHEAVPKKVQYLKINGSEVVINECTYPARYSHPIDVSTILSRPFCGKYAVVKTLELGAAFDFETIPEQMKLKVKEMIIDVEYGNDVIESVMRRMDESSLPLKSLSVNSLTDDDPIFKNEVLMEAEILTMNIAVNFGNTWSNVLKQLPNKNIHLIGQLGLLELLDFTKYWIETRKAIGTTLSMQTGSVREFLMGFHRHLPTQEATIETRKCSNFPISYTKPIDHSSELNIYGSETPEKQKLLNSWMLVLEIMPAGSAVLIN